MVADTEFSAFDSPSINFMITCKLAQMQMTNCIWGYSVTSLHVAGLDPVFMKQKPDEPKEDKEQIVIVSSSLGSMVLLLITIGCVLIERNRRRRQSDHEITHDAIPFESFQGSRPFDSFKGKDDHQIQRAERHIYSNVPEQPKDNHGYPSTIELPDDLEKLRKFSKEDMIYIDCLGEGAFGKVDKYEIQQEKHSPNKILCAVKSLKSNASIQTRSSFLREAEMLASFDHPNIVRLLGVYMGEMDSPSIVLEFMELGDLAEYIRQRAGTYHVGFGNNNVLPEDVKFEPPSLSFRKLVATAKQIAGGMEYLSERKFVHRDLATRNCLVGNNLLVKVADFGLGHDISSMKSEYYSCAVQCQDINGKADKQFMPQDVSGLGLLQANLSLFEPAALVYLSRQHRKSDSCDRIDGQRMLPIRWLPPEALSMGKFTIESDIWSYGVLLWELFTYGMTQYYPHTNEQVCERIRRFQVLECPNGCPVEMYELMKECWNYDVTKRPPFRKIHETLKEWKGEKGLFLDEAWERMIKPSP